MMEYSMYRDKRLIWDGITNAKNTSYVVTGNETLQAIFYSNLSEHNVVLICNCLFDCY